MPDLDVVITGDREVGVKFDTFPLRAHDRLLKRITALTDKLEARVRSLVPHRTGRLASLVKRQIFDDTGRKIVGRVTFSGDFARAGALEYGAHRAFEVKGHSTRLDHVFANRLTGPTDAFVQAYRRTPNVVAERFLRGAEASIAAEATAGIREVVDETASEDVG